MAAIDQLLATRQGPIDLGASLAQSSNLGGNLAQSNLQAQQLMLKAQSAARAETTAAFEQSLRAGKSLGAGLDAAQRRELAPRKIAIQEEQQRLRALELGVESNLASARLNQADRAQDFREKQFRVERQDREQNRAALGLPGGSSSFQGADTKVKGGDYSGITANDLTPHLGKGLQGLAQDFIDAGKEYGVDPRFLAAISKLETANGTSSAFRNKANAMGISNASGPTSQKSHRASIFNQARSLTRSGGYYSNADTIGAIGAVYAPPGAGNDPRGTNGGWPAHVSKFYGQMVGGGAQQVAQQPQTQEGQDPVEEQTPEQVVQGEVASERAAEAEASGEEVQTREQDGTDPSDKYYDPEFIRNSPPETRAEFLATATNAQRDLRLQKVEVEEALANLKVDKDALDEQISQAEEIQTQAERSAAAAGFPGQGPMTDLGRQATESMQGLRRRAQELRIAERGLNKQVAEITLNEQRVEDNLEAAAPKFEKLDQASRQKFTSIQLVSGNLDQIETAFDKMEDKKELSRFMGLINKGMNKVLPDADVTELEVLINASVPGLARGIFGEVGVLTDKDREVYSRMFPNGMSSKEEAVKLISVLNGSLERAATASLQEAKLIKADEAFMRTTYEGLGINLDRANADPEAKPKAPKKTAPSADKVPVGHTIERFGRHYSWDGSNYQLVK